jgi:hypothetical protein
VTTTWLTDEEVADVTRRRQPCAQARVLSGWGVPHRRRPDGTLLVGRAAVEAALTGARQQAGASNGINWRRQA